MASSTADVAANTKPKKATAAKKAKSSPSHPPFLQMITEAIVALKEKTGSSQYAITKYTEEKQKHLPSNFRKLLLLHLKKLVASNKLVKVKNSFKLPPLAAKKPATTTTTTAAAVKSVKPKPKTAAKPKPKAKAPAAAAAAKPKAKAKKAAVKPKAKAAAPAKKVAAAKAKPKKVSAAAKAKGVKKPKSVKSPAKKATVKRAKK